MILVSRDYIKDNGVEKQDVITSCIMNIGLEDSDLIIKKRINFSVSEFSENFKEISNVTKADVLAWAIDSIDEEQMRIIDVNFRALKEHSYKKKEEKVNLD